MTCTLQIIKYVSLKRKEKNKITEIIQKQRKKTYLIFYKILQLHK